MADEQKKKRGKTPWGAIFWGTVGTAAIVRCLYRPDRALIKDGFASSCAGASCDPAMTVDAFEGQQAVFAPMAGVVVDIRASSSTTSSTQSPQATPNLTKVYIVPNGEAVVLEFAFAGTSSVPQVAIGDKVGSGQQIGLASRIQFAVYEITRSSSGHAQIGAALEPASWLAVHGIRISSKKHKSTELWCEGGRKITAPVEVANCLKLPAPSGYALLPISVTSG